MIHLLDVSSLVALGNYEHEFHPRMRLWLRTEEPTELLTCPITELGFIRITSHPRYGYSIEQAQKLLLELKIGAYPPIRFVPDTVDASSLPSWVRSSKQTTDGHLLELARANNATLATLDEGIPGSCLIPRIR